MKILKKRNFFLSLLLRIVCNKNHTQFEKIKIVDFNKKKYDSTQTIFEKQIIDALTLIKQLSPIKYKRVLSQIDSICYTKRLKEDSYIISLQTYLTNGLTQWKDQKLMHIYYAGLLIYLSAYGCLTSKNLDYYMEDKLKIYDICIKIEKRFYKKVEKTYPEYKDLLINKFID